MHTLFAWLSLAALVACHVVFIGYIVYEYVWKKYLSDRPEVNTTVRAWAWGLTAAFAILSALLLVVCIYFIYKNKKMMRSM